VVIGAERRSDGTIIMADVCTCDAEFCAGHGRQLGHIGGEAPDTFDACFEHMAIGMVRLRDLATSAVASAKVRSGIRARALRRRMRLVVP
jgi:hypothetical protein